MSEAILSFNKKRGSFWTDDDDDDEDREEEEDDGQDAFTFSCGAARLWCK